jgi:hemoglobin-like flavoprotein
MNAEQIALVQSSFAKVQPISEQAAALFYARLFELAPQVRPLFKGDMVEQGRKLMLMLGMITSKLNQLDALVPAAQGLARRHVAYGAQAAHYAVVGQALLDTLDKGLGDEFTPEVREAWSTAYAILSAVMIEAAAQQG